MQALSRLSFVAVLVLSLGGVACSASTSDDGETTSQDLTPYDSVVTGGTKIENDDTITATQSAKTHLIGFVKDRSLSATEKQLLSMGKWTQIKNPDGDDPITAAHVSSDQTKAGVRTIAATISLSAGIDLVLGATATTNDDGSVSIHITNTKAASHWFAGLIVDKGKLVIDVKLVPYDNDDKKGTIVDATIKVKMAQMEDKAPGLAEVLPMVFTWLKTTTPASP
jgi:hypothetical protein